MRSRAQEIAIILSKYKKRAGARFSAKTKTAPLTQAILDAAMKRVQAKHAEMARRPASDASRDLARIPHAKLVDEISAGPTVVYPDGSVLELPLTHDDFVSDSRKGEYGNITKTMAEHGAIQVRLWESTNTLSVTIHKSTITRAQVATIMRAAKNAKEINWEAYENGKRNDEVGAFGEHNVASIAKGLSKLVKDEPTTFSMATPKAGLRNVINKLKAQGHRASDWRTVYRSQPSAFDDVVKKSGFMPRVYYPPEDKRVYTGSRRIAQAHGALMRKKFYFGQSGTPQSFYKARVLKKGLTKKSINYDSAVVGVPVVRGHEYQSKKQIPASQIRLISKDKPKRQRKGWR